MIPHHHHLPYTPHNHSHAASVFYTHHLGPSVALAFKEEDQLYLPVWAFRFVEFPTMTLMENALMCATFCVYF